MVTVTIKVTQGLTFSTTVTWRSTALRQLVEQLKVLVDVEALSVPLIEVEAGWLGSYPRPTTAASIIIGVNKYIEEVASPMAGLTVTANVYDAKTGILWKTLTLPETTIPGIYCSTYFKITRYDPLGTYPIIATAKRGLLTRATINGYMVVYAGTPRGISFH